jgi:pyruvate dehydrogenase E1 component alpha subunit
MAELFGRVDGCAHGRGGSMHLLDVERGYYGGWGIVAGQLPIATGLALALVRQGRQQAVLCELGDGAINMGAWHESLNLAAVWRLPVVFLVMNNEYGMGTSVERASAVTDLLPPRRRLRLPAERVDGDDLLAVAQASATLLSGARCERARPCSSSSPTATVATRSPTRASPTARRRDRRAHPPRPDLPGPRAARRRRAWPTPSSTA